MIEDSLYKHSGRFSILGLGTALGLSIMVALFLAYFYNLLNVYIPVIYLNFFIAFVLGAILGYSSKFFSRLGKIRDRKKSLILTGSIGVLAFYFQWVAYFTFLVYEGSSFEAFQEGIIIFFDPQLFFSLLLDLNKHGSWSLFGIQFKDFPLGLFGRPKLYLSLAFHCLLPISIQLYLSLKI